MKTVDIARFLGDQVSQLLFKDKKEKTRCKVKIYTDSKATLDSIASTHQIEQQMLRSCIADLKQKLETKDIQSYEWLTDENMIADILTKEKKSKDGLEEMLRHNTLKAVNGSANIVVEENGEFMMKNATTKESKKVMNSQSPNKVCLMLKSNSSKEERPGNED